MYSLLSPFQVQFKKGREPISLSKIKIAVIVYLVLALDLYEFGVFRARIYKNCEENMHYNINQRIKYGSILQYSSVESNELYHENTLSRGPYNHGNTLFVSATVTTQQNGQDCRPSTLSSEAILRVNLPDQHYNVSLFQCKHGVFLLNPQDSFISRSLIDYGEWEEKELQMLLHAFVTEGDIILDVGANIGSFTIPMAKAVGIHGMVYAWEPLRGNYQKLVANIALNGLSNVKTYWSATSFIPSSTCKVNQVQEVDDSPENLSSTTSIYQSKIKCEASRVSHSIETPVIDYSYEGNENNICALESAMLYLIHLHFSSISISHHLLLSLSISLFIIIIISSSSSSSIFSCFSFLVSLSLSI